MTWLRRRSSCSPGGSQVNPIGPHVSLVREEVTLLPILDVFLLCIFWILIDNWTSSLLIVSYLPWILLCTLHVPGLSCITPVFSCFQLCSLYFICFCFVGNKQAFLSTYIWFLFLRILISFLKIHIECVINQLQFVVNKTL